MEFGTISQGMADTAAQLDKLNSHSLESEHMTSPMTFAACNAVQPHVMGCMCPHSTGASRQNGQHPPELRMQVSPRLPAGRCMPQPA